MEPNLTLLTDLYQLTMAYGYWKTGMADSEATFFHFFRKNPFEGTPTLFCGLQPFIEFVENFHYNKEDLAYLKSLGLFEDSFLDYLSGLKWTVSIDALEEGSRCTANEPLIKVQGPLLQCQLLETPLLNMINFSTLIATKAHRVVQAAQGDPVIEFGARRAQGVNGALLASRSAYVGGVESTSNTLAGKLYGIPVSGTVAHSWVMAFPTELQAFQRYAEVFPDRNILLVDTYDTIEGVKNAIKIGPSLKGIRLDSGDLATLSIESRELLDQAGLKNAKIYASGDLDEYKIADLKRRGCKIDCWGVGTALVTAKDHPYLDGVYKLSTIDHHYKQKLSENKPSLPMPVSTDRLTPIFQQGKRVYTSPPLTKIREKNL